MQSYLVMDALKQNGLVMCATSLMTCDEVYNIAISTLPGLFVVSTVLVASATWILNRLCNNRIWPRPLSIDSDNEEDSSQSSSGSSESNLALPESVDENPSTDSSGSGFKTQVYLFSRKNFVGRVPSNMIKDLHGIVPLASIQQSSNPDQASVVTYKAMSAIIITDDKTIFFSSDKAFQHDAVTVIADMEYFVKSLDLGTHNQDLHLALIPDIERCRHAKVISSPIFSSELKIQPAFAPAKRVHKSNCVFATRNSTS